MRTEKRRNPAYWDHSYRKRTAELKRRVKANGLPCWLCGRGIDTDLPWTHAMSFTADHVQPLAHGGKVLGELRPAHRSCNSSRGAKRTAENVQRPKTTREW